MSIAETLETLRQSHAGCNVAALADLTSRIVLRASAEPAPRQEVLSVLAATAHTNLSDDLADVAKAAMGSDARVDTAIVLHQDSTQVFVASHSNPSDALLFDADTSVEPIALADAARAALARHGDIT